MQEKAELKKQVIILGIILVIVIVIALLLNMNNSNKTYQKSDSIENENKTNANIEEQEDIIEHLKGLIEEQEEEKQFNTDGSETIETKSNEKIQIKETELENY